MPSSYQIVKGRLTGHNTKYDGLVKSHTTRHSREGGNDENGTKSTFYEFVKYAFKNSYFLF